MPAVSDDKVVQQVDPSHQIWVYRTDSGGAKVLDWASSLLPYLGAPGVQSFMFAGDKSKVFRCPSDTWQSMSGQPGDVDGPGMCLFNNVDKPFGYYPISYGINADIGAQTWTDGNTKYGRLGYSDHMVLCGPPDNKPHTSLLPLNAKLYSVQRSSEVMLLADCGVRPLANKLPQDTWNPTPLIRSDILFFSTHGINGVTLKDMQDAKFYGDKIPWNRHRGKINVAFCDGHVSGVIKGMDEDVRITPYK